MNEGVAGLLWLVPALPLFGALLLGLAGRRLNDLWCAVIACGSVGLSAALVCLFGSAYFVDSVPQLQTLWVWFDADGVTPRIALRLDGLSLIMAVVITGVGFLIHLYSSGYMAGEEGYARYFAWLNLFVGAMLVLVLADDLLLLFLGWEGVGLCSYLLIGFWYRDAANGAAARKAMIMTMAGDLPLVIGLLLLFSHFGVTAIPALMEQATATWTDSTTLPITLALLLLAGAVGKSAQLPLQTWLPDAMAGPTPVSALIHAATMVTAGVYLIARLHPLFVLAPGVLSLIAWLGAAGLLLAAVSALVQTDIKRVLAYSTISQLGFMFMALGVGAWTAAMFHLFVHAFFKALLFLAAGVASLSLGHERDLRRMGGLRTRQAWAFWGFLAGSASLAALPYVSAGFFSKDLILAEVWQRGRGALWFAGWLGALLTAAYITRAFVIGFLGKACTRITRETDGRMHLPLAVLIVPTLAAGVFELPIGAGGARLFSDLVAPVLPAAADAGHGGWGAMLAVLAPLLGIGMTWYLLRVRPAWSAAWRTSATAGRLSAWWFHGWGFDALYERVLRRPYARLAARLSGDPLDRPFTGLGHGSYRLWHLLSSSQNGQLRRYAAAVAAGTAVLLAMVLP